MEQPMPQLDNIAYEERVVCFLDILGFSQLIDKSSKDMELVKTIGSLVASMLNQTRERCSLQLDPSFPSEKEENGLEVVHFSDCIVMSVANLDFMGLHWLFCTAINLATLVIRHGVAVRGGIAKGLLYHKDNIVFGPALVEAYHLESKLAQFPRIILSNSLSKYIKNLDNAHRLKMTCISERHDFWIVDYMAKCPETLYRGNNTLPFMQSLRLLIEKGLSESDIAVVSKYEWLRQEYNELLRSYRAEFESLYSVTGEEDYNLLEELSGWPFIG